MSAYMCDTCKIYDRCHSGLKGHDSDCSSYEPMEDYRNNPDHDFPTEWTTFKGKRVSINTIDHQHLSNCYWYLTVAQGLSPTHRMIDKIRTALAERFNGQLLPYRPHVDFRYEIKLLEDKGYLYDAPSDNDSKFLSCRVIVVDGNVIGEIVRPI